MTDFTRPSEKRSNTKWLIIAGIVLVVIVVAVGAFMMLNQKGKSANSSDSGGEAKTATQTSPGLSTVNGYALQYPTTWQRLELTEAENADGVTVKLAKKGKENTATYVMRIVPGKLDKKIDIQKVPDQVATSFKENVDNFSLLDKKVTKFGDFDAADIHYRLDNPKLKAKFENRMYIVPRENRTYYLTISTKGDNLQAIDGEIKQINESVTGYIRANP